MNKQIIYCIGLGALVTQSLCFVILQYYAYLNGGRAVANFNGYGEMWLEIIFTAVSLPFIYKTVKDSYKKLVLE